MSQNSNPRKRRSQEERRNVCECRKNRKSNKDFSCRLKIPSNKYRKNSNNNFNQIPDLEIKKWPRRTSKSPQTSQE